MAKMVYCKGFYSQVATRQLIVMGSNSREGQHCWPLQHFTHMHIWTCRHTQANTLKIIIMVII